MSINNKYCPSFPTAAMSISCCKSQLFTPTIRSVISGLQLPVLQLCIQTVLAEPIEESKCCFHLCPSCREFGELSENPVCLWSPQSGSKLSAFLSLVSKLSFLLHV